MPANRILASRTSGKLRYFLSVLGDRVDEWLRLRKDRQARRQVAPQASSSRRLGPAALSAPTPAPAPAATTALSGGLVSQLAASNHCDQAFDISGLRASVLHLPQQLICSSTTSRKLSEDDVLSIQ